MAESAIAGLFMTPEMYQQQQNALAEARALEYGRLDPMQSARAGFYRAGGQLGGGLATLMGAEDPQLKMITQRQQILGQIDPNNPESIARGAQMAAQMGDNNLAAALADKARTTQTAVTDQASKAATAAKTMAETTGLITAQATQRGAASHLVNTLGLPVAEAAAVAANPTLLADYLKPKTSQAFDLLKGGIYTVDSVAAWRDGTGNLVRIDKTAKPPADWLAVAKELSFPVEESYDKYTPSQVGDVNKLLLVRSMAKASAGATRQAVAVNTMLPASEEAQKEFMKESRATYSALKQAPTTLANIEAAKALVPTAQGFMGAGGPTLLNAVSFLNNRLGTSIDVRGVADAQELNSRTFMGILDNLKKLDSQPSQQQQDALRVALGTIGTDPNALPKVLDVFGDILRGRVELYNAEVTGAEQRGVKFPYDPVIKLPPRPGAKPTPSSAGGGGVDMNNPLLR